jgi:hypothetical protein
MARVLAAFAAVLVLLGGTPAWAAAAAVSAPAPARAMWLWQQAPPEQVVDWATRNSVGTILVNFDGTSDLTALRNLRKRADTARIRVDALGGDPDWVFDPAAAVAWTRAADATGLFTGRHVDVEPYLLPEWTTAYDRTARAYLGLLDTLRTAGRSALEVDVPFWYGQFTVGRLNLADEVVRRVGAVTVMSYRDTVTGPNSIMDVSADMLTRTARRGVKARLAVETQPLPDCPYCTFAEEGRAALTTALPKVDRAAARYAGYSGVAIHHYASWRTLPA